MESLLFNLFDFQRFENNEQLSALIRETGSRYSRKRDMGFRKLSDEELSMAAGGCDPASMSPVEGITEMNDGFEQPKDRKLGPLHS